MQLLPLNLAVALGLLLIATCTVTAYRIPPEQKTYTTDLHPDAPNNCFVPPLPVELPASTFDDVIHSLESNVTSLWNSRSSKIPGSLSVNLIYDQDIIWFKGFGEKNHSDPSQGAPDVQTAYRLGSISKVFTTLIALKMRDEHSWGLDDPLDEIVPNFGVVNPFKTQRGITLRQLASHMAGLSRESPCAGIFAHGCNTTEEVILKRLKSLPLVRPPGLKPSYSNLGFALLGVAEAHWTKDSWVILVKTIASLLGMKNTHADIPLRPNSKIAEGYMPDGSQAEWIDIGFEAPAGQMFSSAYDLSQLIKMIFRPDAPADSKSSQVLDGETIREWMQPVYVAPDLTGFGLVWELFQGGPYNFRAKDGAINGYRSIMLYAPEIKVGAVGLLSNEDSPLLDRVAGALVDGVLGVSDVLAKNQPLPSLPPSPADYVGTYVHDSTTPSLQATVNVSLVTGSGGHQMMELNGALGYPGVLVWQTDDKFQVTSRYTPHPCRADTSGLNDFYVVFARDKNNKVVSATAPGFNYGYYLMKSS